MHAPDPVSLVYYYHPLHHREGRASVEQAIPTARFLNRKASNQTNLLIAEQFFNDGDLDGLMAHFPASHRPDPRAAEDAPFALGFTTVAGSSTGVTRLSGKIFLGGDFAHRECWHDQDDFRHYIGHMRKKTGHVFYTTAQDVTVRFNLCTNDGLADISMNRGRDGLYHQSPLLDTFRLNLCARDDYSITPNPKRMMN